MKLKMKEIIEKIRVTSYVDSLIAEEDGMGVVEIILIIVVLIGLVLLFRKKIASIANNILKQVEEGSKKVNYNLEGQ